MAGAGDDAGGAVLAVRVTPRAREDRSEGWDLDADGRPFLKLRVTAAPVEGEANAAVEALVARLLGVPRREVSVRRGGASRLKQIRVEGLSLNEIRRKLSGPEA